MNILIADDHAVVREGLKRILTGVSHAVEIDGVADGNELMEKIKEKDYDVIVLDISMPGKSGLEVLKELKIVKPKLPVLMLSIYPPIPEAHARKDAGPRIFAGRNQCRAKTRPRSPRRRSRLRSNSLC